MKEYYVYIWVNQDTKEVIYVGFGKNERYCSLRKRNQEFLDYVSMHNCKAKILVSNLSEEVAKNIESTLILLYWDKNQAFLNLHKGGSGGNTVRYLTEEGLQEFKDKASKTSRKNWDNPKIRNKMIQNNRTAMQSEHVRNKISKRTKEAMWEKDCRERFLKGRATRITVIDDCGEVKVFETRTIAKKYITEKFNIPADRITRNKKDVFITKSHRWYCMVGYTIIQEDKDGNKFVSTIRDECSGVE